MLSFLDWVQPSFFFFFSSFRWKRGAILVPSVLRAWSQPHDLHVLVCCNDRDNGRLIVWISEIHIHNCPGWTMLTRYERGGGLSCVTAGVDQGWVVAIIVQKEEIRNDLLPRLSCTELNSLEGEELQDGWEYRSFLGESILGAKSRFEGVYGHVTSSCEGQILTATLVINSNISNQ